MLSNDQFALLGEGGADLSDPRLAAVRGEDGTMRAAVAALLDTHPREMTPEQVVAMSLLVVGFDAEQAELADLADLTWTKGWLDALNEAAGATVGHQHIEHRDGRRIVRQTVRRHPGRSDVRKLLRSTCATQPRTAPRRRERRAAPARRRSSRSSGSDPGPGDEPEPALLRLAPKPRAFLTFGCLSADERGADVAPIADRRESVRVASRGPHGLRGFLAHALLAKQLTDGLVSRRRSWPKKVRTSFATRGADVEPIEVDGR